MRWGFVLVATVVVGVGCSSAGGREASGNSPATVASLTPSASPSDSEASPSSVGSAEGWAPELEEKAAEIFADGIKKTHPLELRLEVGRCVIEKIMTKPAYDTYDEWSAVWVDNEDPAAYLDMVGVLGRCEIQLGV